MDQHQRLPEAARRALLRPAKEHPGEPRRRARAARAGPTALPAQLLRQEIDRGETKDPDRDHEEDTPRQPRRRPRPRRKTTADRRRRQGPTGRQLHARGQRRGACRPSRRIAASRHPGDRRPQPAGAGLPQPVRRHHQEHHHQLAEQQVRAQRRRRHHHRHGDRRSAVHQLRPDHPGDSKHHQVAGRRERSQRGAPRGQERVPAQRHQGRSRQHARVAQRGDAAHQAAAQDQPGAPGDREEDRDQQGEPRLEHGRREQEDGRAGGHAKRPQAAVRPLGQRGRRGQRHHLHARPAAQARVHLRRRGHRAQGDGTSRGRRGH